MINFIHVGDYKTGTTWLQKYAFDTHPEIDYLGDPFRYKVDGEFNRYMYELGDTRDVDFQPEILKAKISEKLCHIYKPNKITGISREALSASNYLTGEHAKRNAERIKAIFGDVKIIFIIREQFSMLASLYSQYIKMGGTLCIADFVFDAYECRGLLERLKYHKTLDMYADIFGKNNVYFDLFERFRLNKNNFLKDIYSFIGCKNTAFLPPEGSKKVNSSLTEGGVLFARFCNHFIRSYHHNRAVNLIPFDKIITKFLPEEKKTMMIEYTEETILPSYGEMDAENRLLFALNSALLGKIRTVSEKITVGNKIKLPGEIEEKLKDRFKESNAVLLKKYNLPVDQHGWSL
ncbi:MAG: sulfotransferase domain-containing protein [Bacteroidota bacterium]